MLLRMLLQRAGSLSVTWKTAWFLTAVAASARCASTGKVDATSAPKTINPRERRDSVDRVVFLQELTDGNGGGERRL